MSIGTYVTPENIERKLGKYWVKRDRDQSRGKINSISGSEYAEIELDLATLTPGGPNYNLDRDNDGTNDGYSANGIYIPANSSIISVTAFVREAAVGGTSIDVGLFEFDGTDVDADGLMAGVAIADIDAVGKRVVGDGVKTVPATSSVGEAPVTVGVTGTGTFTAGVVQIMVEYELN